MGGKCPHRRVKKRKYSHKTDRRSKFLLKADDAIYEELQKPMDERKPLPLDEDLPGMGQYYCLHCDRYFPSVAVRDDHFKSKRHKKRLKQMAGPAPHTQLDAELAAGMGMPDNGPKLMSIAFLFSFVCFWFENGSLALRSPVSTAATAAAIITATTILLAACCDSSYSSHFPESILSSSSRICRFETTCACAATT
ncbi:hypothetical protein Nepgr_011676 [Nepenthes gracilis]|uniref:C2H2-type domain-containing protein n=1 Tax=Nepenthes gracilis TaxID=150966 RepID=A0AAD3SFK7_NEPGR|nr:hypothetical protein Nepgr_011676 [Nepenthes gracilis]